MKKTNKLIYLALLSLASIKAYSQAPRFYQPMIEGCPAGNDIVAGIVGDNNGNVYVTGTFTNTYNMYYNSVPLTNNGVSNVFIAKYGPKANLLWARYPANGTGADSATSIAKDNSGNLYVVGIFRSASIQFGSTTTLTNAGAVGTSDIFMVKYDTTGTAIWAIREGDTGDDVVNDITIDNSSNLYITGNFTSGTLTVAGTTFTNQGGMDIFYAKYDNNGNPVWANSPSNTFLDENSEAIIADGAGDVYITGSFNFTGLTFGSSTLNNGGDFDVYIAKLNSVDGTAIWAYSAGSTGTDLATDIATSASGDIYITGHFNSPTLTFGGITLTNNGTSTYDIFTVKYSSLGTVVWAHNIGVDGDEKANAINIDNCGYVYVLGSLNSTVAFVFNGTSYNSPTGLTDLLLLKYDDNGNGLWAKTMDGGNQGTAISGSIDDNMVIAGIADGDTVFVNGFADTLLNSGGAGGAFSDFFLTKVQTTATDIYVTVLTPSGAPMTNGLVWLYGRKNDYSLLAWEDSVHLVGTNIAHFSNVLNLNYCVLARADTSIFHNLIPTYNDDKYLWDEVITWPHTCANTDYVTINMKQDSLVPSAPGKASGYVTKTNFYNVGGMAAQGGMDRAAGDPDPNATVRIRHNPGGSAIATTTTDVNGYYHFDGLIPGDNYTILVDIPGLGRDFSYDITVTPTDTLFLQRNYCVDSDYVMLCSAPVGIANYKDNNSGEQVTIAPNPFSEKAVITFSEKQNNTAIKITDVLGNIVSREELVVSGKEAVLNMTGYAKGIYFVQITDEKKNRVNKKIVVE